MLGQLGQLGGLFGGDSTANAYRQDVDDLQTRLLAGGEARGAEQAAARMARQSTMQAAAASGNPALAGRQAGLAAAGAASQAALGGAQMRQQAMVQGGQMAQQRIEAERSRQGQAFGALLGAGAAGASMAIPGVGAAQGALGALSQGMGPMQGSSLSPVDGANQPPAQPKQPTPQPPQATPTMTLPPTAPGINRQAGLQGLQAWDDKLGFLRRGLF
jgi:hypothetical protein